MSRFCKACPCFVRYSYLGGSCDEFLFLKLEIEFESGEFLTISSFGEVCQLFWWEAFLWLYELGAKELGTFLACSSIACVLLLEILLLGICSWFCLFCVQLASLVGFCLYCFILVHLVHECGFNISCSITAFGIIFLPNDCFQY